jgi:hypothetical protein
VARLEDSEGRPEERKRQGAVEALTDPINQVTHLSEETAQKLLAAIENSQPLRRLRSSQLATAILGSIGFALFIVGVEGAAQDFPVISNPYGSIGVGLLLLAATGLLLKRLLGSGE